MRAQPAELAVLFGLLMLLFALSALAAAKRRLERRRLSLPNAFRAPERR